MIECIFGLTLIVGGQPVEKLVFYPSHTSVVPTHRRRKDGCLGRSGSGERRILFQSARDSRRLLQLRYYAY